MEIRTGLIPQAPFTDTRNVMAGSILGLERVLNRN